MTEKGISIGLKVLIALASGVAVFVGISASSNCKKRSSSVPEEEPQTTNEEEISTSVGDRICSSLHKAQEISGKISSLVSSFTQVADTAASLFGSNSYGYRSGNDYYYQRSREMTRINPVISTCGCGGCYNNNFEGNYPIFNEKKY